MATIEAHCHCENVRLRFTTDRSPAGLNPVACPCDFCRAHGAVYVADPDGTVIISAQDAGDVIRYRFGERTAEYLVCGRCGNLIAAVVRSGDRCFAAANLMLTGEQPAAEQTDTAWVGQSAAERLAYRVRRWTPAVLEGFSPPDD